MNNPTVSVLLITWNHALYIEQAIKSIADQTYRNFEIVFLDNSSTDGTYEIALAAFKKFGLDIKDISDGIPAGISVNLNKLIEASTGKYIMPLSGDDWWAVDAIEERVKFLTEYPDTGLLYVGGYEYIDDLDQMNLMQVREPNSTNVFEELLQRNFILAIGNTVPKEVYQKVGGYDPNLAIEDWDMWLRIAQSYSVRCLNKPLVYYRRHSTSSSHLDSKKHFDLQMQMLQKYRSENGYAEAYRNLMNNYWRFHAKPSFQNSVALLPVLLKNPFLLRSVYYCLQRYRKSLSK